MPGARHVRVWAGPARSATRAVRVASLSSSRISLHPVQPIDAGFDTAEWAATIRPDRTRSTCVTENRGSLVLYLMRLLRAIPEASARGRPSGGGSARAYAVDRQALVRSAGSTHEEARAVIVAGARAGESALPSQNCNAPVDTVPSPGDPARAARARHTGRRIRQWRGGGGGRHRALAPRRALAGVPRRRCRGARQRAQSLAPPASQHDHLFAPSASGPARTAVPEGAASARASHRAAPGSGCRGAPSGGGPERCA